MASKSKSPKSTKTSKRRVSKQQSDKRKAVKRNVGKRSDGEEKARAVKRPSARATPRDIAVVHRLKDDPHNMLKVAWSDDHNDFVATPVSGPEAAEIAIRANPPFCKNKLKDPTRKYYCEFDVGANEYVCIEVDANDARCR